jgi:hypothetical protein
MMITLEIFACAGQYGWGRVSSIDGWRIPRLSLKDPLPTNAVPCVHYMTRCSFFQFRVSRQTLVTWHTCHLLELKEWSSMGRRQYTSWRNAASYFQMNSQTEKLILQQKSTATSKYLSTM